jgi:two-component system chemotaxis response regulator CheY
MLPLYGITVLGSAQDGEEAITLFKTLEKKPDLIIMDHRLPLKDGIQTMQEILQLDPTSKVLLASADHSIASEALARGACYFLSKPFRIKQLITVIKEQIKTLDHS